MKGIVVVPVHAYLCFVVGIQLEARETESTADDWWSMPAFANWVRGFGSVKPGKLPQAVHGQISLMPKDPN